MIEDEQPVIDDGVEEMDTDTLEAFGETPGAEKKFGAPIHEALYNISQRIILEGLVKEEKVKLEESCLIPENCKLLVAPTLNPEIVCALTESQKSRDQRLKLRQQEIGLVTGAILRSSHLLCRKDFNKADVVKILGDASRLISNLHFQYTDIRRKLIAPALDKNLQSILTNNARDEFLYSNFVENNKTCNVLKKVSTNISRSSVKRLAQKNIQPPRRPETQGAQSFRGGRSAYQTRRGLKQQPPQRGRPSYNQRGARYP